MSQLYLRSVPVANSARVVASFRPMQHLPAPARAVRLERAALYGMIAALAFIGAESIGAPGPRAGDWLHAPLPTFVLVLAGHLILVPLAFVVVAHYLNRGTIWRVQNPPPPLVELKRSQWIGFGLGVLQIMVFLSVMFASIFYKWGNGYAPAIVALGAAVLITQMLVRLPVLASWGRGWIVRTKPLLFGFHQRGNDR
jgi:hypothetical protein